MKKNQKGFTIVELVIVIAVIAILAAALIPTFTNVIQKANGAADTSLLTNINKILAVEESDGSIKTTKDVYQVLSVNRIAKSSIVAKQNGYEFVYNKDTNRFEYLKEGWKDYGTISAATWRDLFGYTTGGGYSGATGFKTYTDSTTYTYKYVATTKQGTEEYYDVLVGDTVTEDNTLTYWLHVPENYDPRISYPLITYIHGSGGNLYYQNWNEHGVRLFTEADISNQTYAMRMIYSGSNLNRLSTNLYADGSIGTGGAFGGDWDNGFALTWFNWIKTHPEDDAIFVFVQMNDELWFENPAVYTIGGQTYNQLCISNAWKAGPEYGTKLTTGSGNYNSTYVAEKLGVNVWFQLLDKLQDRLMEQYNIDSDRQFISGSSLGGQSTFDLLAHYPDRYAAAFPCVSVCTDVSDAVINAALGTKIIALVGASSATGSDGAVSANPTNEFIQKFKAAGGDAEMIIAGGGHGTGAFKNQATFEKIIKIMKEK